MQADLGSALIVLATRAEATQIGGMVFREKNTPGDRCQEEVMDVGFLRQAG